jgi:hypothetical protein
MPDAWECRVSWYNPLTRELQECVVKSLKLDKSLTHPRGREGWEADAVREATALLRMAGVPGVVGFRRLVRDADGGIHLILEYAPRLCRHAPFRCAVSLLMSDGVCPVPQVCRSAASVLA